MVKQLSPEKLAKAMRRGIAGEANRLKKRAQQNAQEAVASRGINVNGSFRNLIRTATPRDLTGFVVTPVPKKKKGERTDDSKKEVPPHIAMWLDTGTDNRETKTYSVGRRGRRRGKKYYRKRKGHPTGRMLGKKGGALRFMERTEREEMPGAVDRIAQGMGEAVMRIARKEGLI